MDILLTDDVLCSSTNEESRTSSIDDVKEVQKMLGDIDEKQELCDKTLIGTPIIPVFGKKAKCKQTEITVKSKAAREQVIEYDETQPFFAESSSLASQSMSKQVIEKEQVTCAENVLKSHIDKCNTITSPVDEENSDNKTLFTVSEHHKTTPQESVSSHLAEEINEHQRITAQETNSSIFEKEKNDTLNYPTHEPGHCNIAKSQHLIQESKDTSAAGNNNELQDTSNNKNIECSPEIEISTELNYTDENGRENIMVKSSDERSSQKAIMDTEKKDTETGSQPGCSGCRVEDDTSAWMNQADMVSRMSSEITDSQLYNLDQDLVQEGNCFTGTKEAPHIEKRRKLLHNPLKNETEAAVQNVIKELSGINSLVMQYRREIEYTKQRRLQVLRSHQFNRC